MLTGEICAIDHSHKVTKQIARVNGEQVFTALLTVTNEKGEIRICNFVATKSHSQFEIALTRMRNSLEQYGHKQPMLFYTDNMADKQFLENSFPSLQLGVTPIEKYANLEPLNITSSIVVFDSTESINNAVSTILDDVPVDHGEIVVGFDSEWDVELSPQGFVRSVGNTAVIQIAYKKRVLILQIANMANRGVLPSKLQLFLSHPRIRKAGRLVTGDLTRLQNISHSSQPFVGGLDLAKLAKERFLIKISYAAMDAYAALEIYTKLVSDYQVPSPLPLDPPPLSPILILGSDLSSVIAEGSILLNPPENKVVDGVLITKKHIVINVVRVHNRGAIISSHQKRSLDSFGDPPFSLICLRNHLRLYSPTTSNPSETTTATTSTSTSTLLTSTCIPPHVDVSDDLFDIQNKTISLGESLSSDISGTESANVTNSFAVDNQSASVGAEIIGEVPSEWDYSVHSRVLKDVWHVFHMLYLPATHALRKQFTRELRDAFFIPNEDDQRHINSWGAIQKPPKTYQELRNSMPDWTRARCRHIIPPPHLLYPLCMENCFKYS
ncbi:hypothetical protein AGABI1DRAFT_133695 [Agaricus bisporus var. burnettii JB137-S8]|uniref:3'-5' exonuclease domain-containing protein n=1 Tax=Agaricus bisporus var. burnettii (strain JB137-S8 / ATCC MYA-4627 / FGSC 10392) TaxID=597362 RepID=K5VI83_AGABU|nr:uncharacterized protein AGABI1DRAFT_133695 [Agaricus bisporus var. burnettii JB137-S8]EKM74049.1 hypothetical protein AGABI1DRAFT_133695 [Agaricus bisporus var. burnettii JB137-S8]